MQTAGFPAHCELQLTNPSLRHTRPTATPCWRGGASAWQQHPAFSERAQTGSDPLPHPLSHVCRAHHHQAANHPHQPQPCIRKPINAAWPPWPTLRATTVPPSQALSLPAEGGSTQPPPVTAAPQPQPATKPQPKKKTPLQQQILNGILGISNVPYSSYVPEPATFLHKVDARIKQVWLVALYFMIARASIPVRVSIAAFVALASVVVLPPRLCWSQLSRLGILCAVILVFTALGADGIPPVLQPRAPTVGLDGLVPIPPTSYNYVILHVFFITITHRSINLAVTAAALTFCALQTASLCLVTTPGEEMAMALRWFLTPLKLLRVPVQEISLTLLLSLRFMSLVFEEVCGVTYCQVRNLCLGLAARGVDWSAQGGKGSLAMASRLCSRLFANLFHRSENIAQAMVVRGFQGPENQRLYMMNANKTSLLANIVALMALAGLSYAVAHFK